MIYIHCCNTFLNVFTTQKYTTLTKTKKMSKRDIKKCVLEIIDYLGSRNGFDNWWLQVENNEESEITKKLEDIIEKRLNQNKDE